MPAAVISHTLRGTSPDRYGSCAVHARYMQAPRQSARLLCCLHWRCNRAGAAHTAKGLVLVWTRRPHKTHRRHLRPACHQAPPLPFSLPVLLRHSSRSPPLPPPQGKAHLCGAGPQAPACDRVIPLVRIVDVVCAIADLCNIHARAIRQLDVRAHEEVRARAQRLHQALARTAVGDPGGEFQQRPGEHGD
eukprot:43302-Chlamydomonas_euryale.AAC.5